MTKDYSRTNWGVRIATLGYSLHANVTDSLGRNRKYRTSPMIAGVVGYFDSLAELVLWVRQVEEIRALAGNNTRWIDAVNAGIIKPAPSHQLLWSLA